MNDTSIYLIEEADGDEDDYQFRPEVESDTELLFDIKNINPAHYHLDLDEKKYLDGDNEPAGAVGSHEDPSTIYLTGPGAGIVNLYDDIYHESIIFEGVRFKLKGVGDPILEKNVPLLLYTHGHESENILDHLKTMFQYVYHFAFERYATDED